jgi:hypothetical protein
MPGDEIEIVSHYKRAHRDKRLSEFDAWHSGRNVLTFLRNVGTYLPDYATYGSSRDEM